jgi:hypothetical protein
MSQCGVFELQEIEHLFTGRILSQKERDGIKVEQTCFGVAAISAYTLESRDPTYTVDPSALTAGDENTYPPVVYDHLTDPVKAFRAYTLESYDPTYTVDPSALTAGDEVTAPPVEYDHLTDPVKAFSAYTL